METIVASVACCAAIAWAAERLARARDVRWAVLPVAAAVGAWLWLWSLRLPPSPGSALLTLTIADLGVFALGVVGVMRLLGAFDREAGDGEDDERGDTDDPAPMPPWDPPPPQRRRQALPRHHVPPRNRRREDHRGRRPTEV